jgi:zinc protease
MRSHFRMTAGRLLMPVLALLFLFTGLRALEVPVEYHTLDNGLRIVLSPDSTSPIVVVAVYYNIGFRLEPKGRTGFAHLFEHMMFQGSANVGKFEMVRLVESNGGVLNGSTRYDFTNYFEVVPAHKLETMLWAEADRMRSLALTEENLVNQKGVVSNEVKNAVLNQPYGGFPWLDLPMAANVNWVNAHNFYGDLKDLEAASLQEVKDFFKTYYAPNNAVVALVGDFAPAEALALVRKHFGDIPAQPRPAPADLSEPRQEQEKRVAKEDPLANRPALAFGYHVPERWTPEYFAMGLIDQILLQGQDSRLYQKLVQEKGVTSSVDGGLNWPLGDMFDYKGPMLWSASIFHDATTTPQEILALVDEEVNKLGLQPVEAALLERALIKVRSSLYSSVRSFFGFGRANLLASLALFDGHPERINAIEQEFRKVTPELIQKTAREYLRPTNRTIIILKPKAAAK